MLGSKGSQEFDPDCNHPYEVPMTVCHYLPANKPVPRALIWAILADMKRGAQVVLVRSQ